MRPLPAAQAPGRSRRRNGQRRPKSMRPSPIGLPRRCAGCRNGQRRPKSMRLLGSIEAMAPQNVAMGNGDRSLCGPGTSPSCAHSISASQWATETEVYAALEGDRPHAVARASQWATETEVYAASGTTTTPCSARRRRRNGQRRSKSMSRRAFGSVSGNRRNKHPRGQRDRIHRPKQPCSNRSKAAAKFSPDCRRPEIRRWPRYTACRQSRPRPRSRALRVAESLGKSRYGNLAPICNSRLDSLLLRASKAASIHSG